MSYESLYPRELAEHVGYVVLEAAETEDLIGELLVLRGGLDKPDPNWWASGEALAKAIEKIGDPALQPIADEMRELLAQRNALVHGLFLGYGQPRVTMKRHRGNKGDAPSFQFRGEWTDAALADVAHRFHLLGRMVDNAISDAMGITSPSSP
ncbi:hypothetical protein [Williamsia sp. 1135]|uniref:hypothetical protein n=1 Tax=Williamsia sp. 1135 TaxID=1889262 RepID=UPI00117EDEE2|nr:hypothetical protein [Williamsia sp. 1135]